MQTHFIVDDTPICDKECPEGAHCELMTVSCATTPCPPVDTCVAEPPLDAGTEPPDGTQDAGTEPPDEVADAGTEPPDEVADAGTEPPDEIADAGTEPPDEVADAGTEPPLAPTPSKDGDEVGCSCGSTSANHRPFLGLLWAFGLLTVMGVRRKNK